MDKRALRLSLEQKLKERRALLTQNSELRHDIGRERERNRFLLDTLSNPLVDMALEDCADQIMKAVIDHAIKASSVVADETIDNGDYEIGISIPPLHIRQRLYRADVRDARALDNTPGNTPIRRVHVNTK